METNHELGKVIGTLNVLVEQTKNMETKVDGLKTELTELKTRLAVQQDAKRKWSEPIRVGLIGAISGVLVQYVNVKAMLKAILGLQ